MEQKSELEKFIAENEAMNVEVSPGVSYSLRAIIDENYRLLNARFKTNAKSPDGFINVFTRKMWVVFRTLIQGADVDTKDIKVSSLNAVKQFLLNMFRMVFLSHFNRTFFGEFIDEVKEAMCWQGSAIVKRFDGQVGVVDLRNYITEAGIKDPQNRRHAEAYEMTYDWVFSNEEEWKKNDKKSWEAVENLWKRMQEQGVSAFRVVDFWTWEFRDGDMHKVCKRNIDTTVLDEMNNTFLQEFGQFIEVDSFITPYPAPCETVSEKRRYGKEKEMFPYEQFDFFNIPGRWLGLGVGELLAQPQMMYDELFNVKRKMNLKDLMGILVHKAINSQNGLNGLSELSQDSIAGLETGTVIRLSPGEDLEQLRIDEKGADFAQMEEKIYELMLQIIGITAQGTGQTVAPSTSATQIQDNRLVENKVYEYTKERIHHGFVRLMRHGYAQDIIGEITEQQVMAIIGDPRELKEMDRVLIDNAMNKWMRDTKEATGLYPREEEVAMTRQTLEQEFESLGGARYPQMTKEVFKDLNLYIEWNLVDESVDNKQRIDTLNALANEAKDPNSDLSFNKINDERVALAGLNPAQFKKSAEEVALAEQQRQEAMMAQQGVNQPAMA